LGNREGARQELQKTIEIDPNLGPAHYRLGLLYAAEGQLGLAEKAFRTALAINPQDADAQRGLAALSARRR